LRTGDRDGTTPAAWFLSFEGIMRRHPLIILAFAAAAFTTACETDLTPTIVHIGSTGALAAFPAGAPLIITPNFVTIAVGQSIQLFTNAPDTLRSQLQWFSQIPTIASVNQSGIVTGGTPGTTIITVRFSSDTVNSAAATVQVIGPTVR
jgi:Bacterial Ig-like domain (group 2)